MRKSGFTLIELSIVLVVIGLIVGGVLVGQDLIKAAEVRSAVADIQQIKTNMNAFRLKYNCLPGDCPDASTFGIGTNGDGNKLYGGSQGGGGHNPFANEGRTLFWEHLQKSGLWELGLSNPGVFGTTFAKGVNIPIWGWLEKNTRGTSRNEIADIYLRAGNPCNWHGWNGCEDYQVWVTDNYLHQNRLAMNLGCYD